MTNKQTAAIRSALWLGTAWALVAVFAVMIYHRALRPAEIVGFERRGGTAAATEPQFSPVADPAMTRVAFQGKQPMREHPFPRSFKAPGLDGGAEWMNTAGPLDLRDLKGKFVILDFWTYCCINCMHILPELKKLEHKYPNNLVVIGVHSAKFDGEKDSQNIRDAILRYEIEHPVVNDANHKIWRAFGVNSWPSLRVIDPEGKVVAMHSGEIEFKDLNAFFEQALPYYKERGLLDETPLQFNLEQYRQRKESPLFFPGKVLADAASQRLFIADSNHNRIVIASLDGKLIDTIGSGAIGMTDGAFDRASFNKPQGMALLGNILYVADTENHMLRKVDLAAQTVITISGTGAQRRLQLWPGMNPDALDPAQQVPKRFVAPARGTELNSPWALWIHGEKMYIAMAGPHQIWAMTLDEKEIGPFAGNGREDIVDGKLLPPFPYREGYSSFAQPSGLASDGEWLFVADSEGSSVRAVPFDEKKLVKTVVGTQHLDARLFEFGDVDGPQGRARMQHCLDVAYLDGQLYVADTYNNKIKVIDVKKRTLDTFVGDGKSGKEDDVPRFDEPAGLSLAGGKLYVADTNNHAIRVIDLATKQVSTLAISGLTAPHPADDSPAVAEAAPSMELPAVKLKSSDNKLEFAVTLKLPKDFKINPLAPMSYRVESQGQETSIDRTVLGKPIRLPAPTADFKVSLPVTMASGQDKLRISTTYYYCKDGREGLCKVATAIWIVPITWSADGELAVAELSHKPE